MTDIPETYGAKTTDGIQVASPTEFNDHGERELKGVSGRCQLYTVKS